MFSFVFIIPGLPLHSVSSIEPLPSKNRPCYRDTVECDMDESPNSLTNILHIFAAINPALQQNFIAACCSKFFSVIIYNTSNERTILQNALIQLHINGMTSNLVCRWRRVCNNFPNFYDDCATSLDFRGTVSKLMECTVYVFTLELLGLTVFIVQQIKKSIFQNYKFTLQNHILMLQNQIYILK